jgi:hypothetical protein
MKKAELLTKDDIARELSADGDEPLSIRSVERYIQLAEVQPAVKGSGRGKQAKFSRADVEKIKTAYKTAAERREQQSTALATIKPATPASVALVAELLSSNTEGFQRLQSALDTWPVWLTRVDALERTGLPVTWFDAGVRHGELPHVGEGRGRRFHRDDVRSFAEKVRDRKYLGGLFE